MTWRPRRHKYGAVPTVVDGHRFDSRAEAHRYGELALMQRAGVIHDLTPHPRFPLHTLDRDGQPAAIRIGKRAVVYVADFRYTDATGRIRIEDVKGFDTDTARLKRAIFEANYGTTVEVIREGPRTAAGGRARPARPRQTGTVGAPRRPARVDH